MTHCRNFCCIRMLFNWAPTCLIQPAVLSVPSDDFCTKVRPSVIFAGFQASALFRVITQLIVVIPYRLFGRIYRSHLRGPRNPRRWDKSRNVGKYHYKLRNIPEERRSHFWARMHSTLLQSESCLTLCADV